MKKLTKRHLQIIKLIAQGLTNKQISVKLGIREKTVKFHNTEIFKRLGINSRSLAIVMYHKNPSRFECTEEEGFLPRNFLNTF